MNRVEQSCCAWNINQSNLAVILGYCHYHRWNKMILCATCSYSPEISFCLSDFFFISLVCYLPLSSCLSGIPQTGCIVSTDTVATFVLQVCQRLRRALAMADTSQAKPKTEKGCITHGTPRSFIDAGHVDLARQQDVDRSSGCPLSSLGLPSETYQQGSEDTPICFPVMQRHFKDVARPYEFLERNRDRYEHVHQLY